MNEEKDFFQRCFGIVAGLEVENEAQAIAKEVVLDEVENLQKQNTELKDNWNKLKEWLEETENYFADVYKKYDTNDLVYRYYKGAKNATGDTLLKMQEIEKGGMNEYR